MKNINLDKIFKDEVKAVKSMKERGIIQDYRSHESSGRIFIKAEGEWIEVWNIDDALDSNKPIQGN